MSDAPGEPAAIECPRCGRAAVVALRPIASACLPFPAMEALRCQACGHEGTRVRLGGSRDGRVLISWGAPLR